MDQFDPQFPPFIEGDVTNVAVLETGEVVPNLVIDPNEPFEVQVDWKVFGILVPLWLTALDQEFVVSVYAEGMGASPEIRIGTATKDKDDFTACAGNNCREYSVRVPVGPSTLTEDAGNESGIYKLVVSVFLNSNIQGGKFDLMGFREGPFIQIEDLA
jgi:hypothetical protein